MVENHKQEEGLTGRLDVNFGDLIKLTGDKGRVAGYVINYGKEKVILSLEDPTFPLGYYNRAGLFTFTAGNREYWLNRFSNFEVIRPREGKQQ